MHQEDVTLSPLSGSHHVMGHVSNGTRLLDVQQLPDGGSIRKFPVQDDDAQRLLDLMEASMQASTDLSGSVDATDPFGSTAEGLHASEQQTRQGSSQPALNSRNMNEWSYQEYVEAVAPGSSSDCGIGLPRNPRHELQYPTQGETFTTSTGGKRKIDHRPAGDSPHSKKARIFTPSRPAYNDFVSRSPSQDGSSFADLEDPDDTIVEEESEFAGQYAAAIQASWEESLGDAYDAAPEGTSFPQDPAFGFLEDILNEDFSGEDSGGQGYQSAGQDFTETNFYAPSSQAASFATDPAPLGRFTFGPVAPIPHAQMQFPPMNFQSLPAWQQQPQTHPPPAQSMPFQPLPMQVPLAQALPFQPPPVQPQHLQPAQMQPMLVQPVPAQNFVPHPPHVQHGIGQPHAAPGAHGAHLQPPPAQPAFIPATPSSGAYSRAANGGTYGETIASHAPVNTEPLYHHDITLDEILIFFTNWLQIPEVKMRFLRNQLKDRDLAKIHLHSVNMLTKDDLRRVVARFRKQSQQAGAHLYPAEVANNNNRWDASIAHSKGLDSRFTAGHWLLKCKYATNPQRANRENFGHVPLSKIYGPIPRHLWPQGPGRGALTQCLEYAYNHPQENLSTMDWARLVHQHQFATPPATGTNRDQADMARLMNLIHDPLF